MQSRCEATLTHMGLSLTQIECEMCARISADFNACNNTDNHDQACDHDKDLTSCFLYVFLSFGCEFFLNEDARARIFNQITIIEQAESA